MANVYVYSGAAGAGTGADWTNAYTTLAAAFTAKLATDDFWVANDHAETQASAMTLTSPGTSGTPVRVICVNRAGSVPPVSADLRTTATVTTTGNNAISIANYVYFYGITFSCGNGANAPTLTLSSNGNGWQRFEQCALRHGGTSTSVVLFGNVNGGRENRIEWFNTTYQVAAAGTAISIRNADFVWQGTTSAITGATLPTTLFGTSTSLGGTVLLEGVDLSALGSGNTLVPSTAAAIKYIFKDCKLGSSVTVAAAPGGPGYATTNLVRCDSGDTNYRTEKYAYTGTQTTETTIVRTGGASDGTTPIAWKIITTANSKRYLPFEALPISIWNETTGSAITLTIQGIWGGGAVPTNADIWMDVEYLGTSGFPLGGFASSGPADQLAAGTNLSAGSGTWGGSTTKFVLEKTFTPQEKGPITVYIRAATASSTFYIDPLPTINGVTVSRSMILGPGVYVNESGGAGRAMLVNNESLVA